MGAESMQQGKILKTETRGRLFIASLSSPPNRFSLALIEQLNALALELKGRRDIGAVWLRGEGDNFSHGADLRDPGLATLVLKDTSSRQELARLGQSLIETWMTLPFPTVISCQGHVLGAGACLMAASSFRFATSDTNCGFPEIDLGMTLSWGILPRLVRELGPSWTRRLVLAGERVPLSEFGSGFVQIVSDEELDSVAREFAEQLAQKPQAAIRHTLESLHALDVEHQSHALDDADRFALTAGGDDFKKAVMRFLGAKK